MAAMRAAMTAPTRLNLIVVKDNLLSVTDIIYLLHDNREWGQRRRLEIDMYFTGEIKEPFVKSARGAGGQVT